MISKKDLRELVNQKLKDANALMAKKRYATAIYIAGYALELALKLKICKIFKFAQGFPENKTDFSIYQNSSTQQPTLFSTISKIKDIRNHDLNKLLFYSGTEYNVKLNLITEWNLVVSWNPEMRYKILIIRKQEAETKIKAIKTLIQNIL
jgi:hypothetical protein